MRTNSGRWVAAGLSMAWAGSLFAAQPPGQLVPETQVPEAMREVKVVEPKKAPRTEREAARRSSTQEQDSARSAAPDQGEVTTEIWQPRYAGERVEHATGRPEHHFRHGPDNPELRAGAQGNQSAPMGIVQPAAGLIIAPPAKPQSKPAPQSR